MGEEVLFNCDIDTCDEIFNSLSSVFTPQSKESSDVSYIFIGNHMYEKVLIVEEIEIIIRLIQTEWFRIQSVALYGKVISYDEMLTSRELINKSLSAIKECLYYCKDSSQKKRYMMDILKHLNYFSNFVVPLCELDNDFLLRMIAVNINNNKCPVYQYFHANLDLQCYLLILNYLCGRAIDDHIEKITRDLIILCGNSYRKQQTQFLFVCPCVKQFWLILQLFKEKTETDTNTFWNMFNKLLANEEPLFSLCLLKEVSTLQSINPKFIDEGSICCRIKSNFEFLESKLKSILLSGQPNNVVEMIRLIDPVVNGLWLKNGRIEVYQIIWDYYSKRLNMSKKHFANFSAVEFYKLLDDIFFSRVDCEDFELFIGILIFHLRVHPEQWGKIKGRIYSQLGISKIKELNEAGIAHIMLLFMSLSSLYYEEMLKKILLFIEVLIKERNIPIIWNIYTSFIFLQLRETRSLETAAPLLVQMLQEASCDSNKFYLINNFMNNFKHMLNLNKRMDLHQWLFLNSWLEKYISTCYYADLNSALDILLLTLEKVGSADFWPFWKPVFKEHVYPVMKKVSSTPNAPATIGTICGKLCLLIPELANEIFIFFTAETMSPKVSAEFLIRVLDDFPDKYVLLPHQTPLALHSWIKVCLLSMDSPEELTKIILKLDILPPSLKSHIMSAQYPLYAFIEYLGSDIKSHLQSSSINKLCDFCFGHIDKWLPQYLTNPDNEVVVFRIYTFLSLAFLHCGSLLYNPNKTSSPLTKLIQSILLPTEFLVGKPLHVWVLNAVKKTWHLFFEALIKLNVNSDMYLERTLRDMVTKYVPYFSTTDSPIIKCFDNERTVSVLLQKISGCYLKHPVREPEANVLKILNVLKTVIESTTSLSVVKVISDKCLYGLFEIMIFHSQRNSALGVIKSITSSSIYSQIKTEFCNAIVAITEKHLALSTVNYFQLMFILAKLIPADMKNLLGVIKQHISKVERLRCVGYDQNLRMHYEKLESAVNGYILSK